MDIVFVEGGGGGLIFTDGQFDGCTKKIKQVVFANTP